MFEKRWLLMVCGVFVAAIIAGCGAGPAQGNEDQTGTEVPDEATEGPTSVPPTATPVPRQELIICAPAAPEFSYAVQGQQAEAGGSLAVAAAMLPLVSPPPAQYGDDYLADGSGLFVSLPDADDETLIENFDGSITVTLKYRDDLFWSDGEPFDVDDALLGFKLPSLPNAPRFDVLDTERIDDLTLEVTAAAGAEYPYVPAQMPLPAHIWGIEDFEHASFFPDLMNPTLGPYVLDGVDDSGTATFLVNPHHPAAGSLIPTITWRTIEEPPRLAEGTCDILLDGSVPFDQLEDYRASVDAGESRVYRWAGSFTEQALFNTYPPTSAQVPYFADARVRKAFVTAVDRALIAEGLWGEAISVMDSWLPAGHWAQPGAEALTQYPADIQVAADWLDEAGWRDEDDDGIREYVGEGGSFGCQRGEWRIENGTALSPTLLIPEGDTLRGQIADQMVQDLSAVGVALRTEEVPPEILYAEDGPLTLREFDVVLLAGAVHPDPGGINRWVGADVFLHPTNGEIIHRWELPELGRNTEFMVERLAVNNIPHPANDYQGQNYGGWCNEDANRAIIVANKGLDPETRREAYAEQQVIFSEQVPAIPFFARPRLGAAASFVCGVQPVPYAPLTSNIEQWWFDESGTCER